MPDNGYISAVYFSSWSVYAAKHFAYQLPTRMLSHVFYAFLQVDANTGTVSLPDPWADVDMPMISDIRGSIHVLNELKTRDRKLKVIMSIGGWGTKDALANVMDEVVRMNNFVTTAVSLLIRYKFDGIDLDWEYPENDDQAAKFAHMITCLKAELNDLNPDLILTAAAPAGFKEISILKIKQMDMYLSFWNIMCYDFCGEDWSSRTGYHSNLYGDNGDNELNAELVINKYIELGVPPHKLVLGMPMYGRAFGQPSAPHTGSCFEKGASGTKEPIEYNAIDRTNEVFDGVRVSASVYDEEERVFTVYDNPQCVAEKATFIVKRGLGGGFFWDSKGDTRDHELLRAFHDGIYGDIDDSSNCI